MTAETSDAAFPVRSAMPVMLKVAAPSGSPVCVTYVADHEAGPPLTVADCPKMLTVGEEISSFEVNVRVIVSPDELTDNQTIKLAQDLRNKIQEKLTYPGTIKVTAVREFRREEVAK